MLEHNLHSAMAEFGASNPLQEMQMRLQAPASWMQGVIKVRAHADGGFRGLSSGDGYDCWSLLKVYDLVSVAAFRGIRIG